MKSHSLNKIVWAVDVAEPLENYKNALFIIGSLSRATSAQVFPSYVFSRSHSARANEIHVDYLTQAEKRMQMIAKTSDIPRIAESKVIVDQNGSTRSAVDSLIRHANQKNADAIVVATHTRSALSTFFLGGFAETLLLQSPIPVITVNPLAKVREKISKILFPTSLNKKFRKGFEQTVELAKKLDAEVTIFYKEPFYPMMELSPEVYELIEEQLSELKATAKDWANWAEAQHVPVKVHLDPQPGPVADEVVDFAAKGNFDLIALVSQTEMFEAPRVGSLCRKVVRTSPCAVWILKTDDLEASEIG